MTEMKEGTYDTIGYTKPLEDSQAIPLQMVKFSEECQCILLQMVTFSLR